jgi:hypothetical protein
MNLAIYNPKSLPIDQLPVIYGFNGGGEPGWMMAYLVAQDGTGMGSHLCSSEGYMPGDLGCLEGTRPNRHEGFREHYPEGYRMEFVRGNYRAHAGLMEALRLNQQQAKADAEKAEQA